jgi:alkanesulfonate monooxygenase SsuD/methylene tetrahydromethanopterin reductase-like flavin-dependent oxidoreductase (luciferase family)
MNIGIGLPAAVPGTNMAILGEWAADAERAGFSAIGVIDRLVYDNAEPLIALATAAARTKRVELVTTVLNIGWRRNPILLAKQLASVEQISGGRLTAGLGLGGWPEDYLLSAADQKGGGELWRSTLATMRDAWTAKLTGQGGPISRLPAGRPALLFGGLVGAAYRRAATEGDGWVAPLMGLSVLQQGVTEVRSAWATAERAGAPRVVTGRYFGFGPDAEAVADEYLRHYYGDEFFPVARADTVTTIDQLRRELPRLEAAGTTDVILYPTSGDLHQIELLRTALHEAGYHDLRRGVG